MMEQLLAHFWITLTFTLLTGINCIDGTETPVTGTATITLTNPTTNANSNANPNTSPIAGTKIQEFRVTPHDSQILEGTDTLLHCEVANRAGQVQWTKDGFAFGFSAVIHGFPRYSVLVDAPNGIYNLQIKNASLEDDAEYQCQVGPAPGNPAIRANAKLTIIAAPSSIIIDGYAQNAKVEVIEKQNLTLKCVAENANPAAGLAWNRNNLPLTGVEPHVEIIESTPKRFTTISIITFQPTIDDDYKDFSCEAKHKALPPDVPMRSTVQLSVLYPPGMPFFEGYSQGEPLRRGQNIKIACRSRGGNPPAELVWYKNNVPINSPQRISGRLSENIYNLIVNDSDNDANLICEAKNALSNMALRAQLNLTVWFPPKEVVVSGVTEAKLGEIVQLSCVTAPSNPAARISWSLNGRPLANTTYETIHDDNDGGWISSSNVSITIDSQSRTFVIVCHALNVELVQNVVGSHSVHVLYPPSPPLLTGHNDGDVIISGSIKKLQCSSLGGNPPPTLTWYKNDKKLNAITKSHDSKTISELTILVNASDNNAIYKCEIHNAAIDIPLFATKTLNVNFPPETVKISVEPKNLVPGIRAKLICDSSSSNPPAKVSWWRDGIPVDGVNLSNKPGLWSGSITTLELYVNITQDLDGIIYTCQSNNEILQRSVHESISLDILYPPKFENTQNTVYVAVEGDPLYIELHAIGNPMAMTYTWTKNGLPILSNGIHGQRIWSDGPILNISTINRNDAGHYICEAMNSQGTAILEVEVIVEYPPYVETYLDEASFVEGDNAILSCNIKARPMAAEYVTWSRLNYNMDVRTSITFENNTSHLHINNVEKSDMGNFTCTVDNKRGQPAHKDILLIVQSAPKLDQSPIYTRFAERLGNRARLICRAFGAPQPNFNWRRHGKDLKLRRNKYKTIERKIDSLTYESHLIIENTSTDDYGQFECVARNAFGQATLTLNFSKPMKPDAPLALHVSNITDKGVHLIWTPGFDGGLPVYYRLRFKSINDDKYKYMDAQPGHLNITLDGLKSGNTYVFSIMAINEAGGSKFLPDIKLTLTKGSMASTSELNEKDEMPNLMIIGITSSAMVLLVLNAALVAWFVIRRQSKNVNETEASNDDAYSKEDNQSIYKADVQKQSTTTYLVENVDIIQSTSYPPKYQESSMCTPPYPCNPDFTRTLPNPKRYSNRNGISDPTRSKDDHMLVPNGMYIPAPSPASSLVIKGSYISSPSPAPPPDGSYFNMSDKYMSYPPVAY